MSLEQAPSDLAEDVQRIDGNVNGLATKVARLADRVEELEDVDGGQ